MANEEHGQGIKTASTAGSLASTTAAAADDDAI